MKRLLSLALSAFLCLAAGAQEFHSLWIVPKKTAIGAASPIGSGEVTPLEHGWEFSIPVGRMPAGSYIEWDFTISATSDAPEFYAVEYFDQGRWKVSDTLRCTRTADSTKELTTELRTLRLEDAIGRGNIQLRLRAVSDGVGRPKFVHADNTAASVRFLGTQAPRDTIRVLCIGNSFTYVAGSSWMLKEIAWSQGHYIDMQDALKGGQTFGQHLALTVTADKVAAGGYDHVFLQNQSQTNAWYAQDRKGKSQILDDAVELAARVREHSPRARLWFEQTWSYPGKDNGGFASLSEFDRLLSAGTRRMASATKASVSPIGKAFAICRSERPDIPMYASDDKHQSEYGAYLKACVNYLLMFREPFGSGVQDCSLDPDKTAYLRRVASRVTGVR